MVVSVASTSGEGVGAAELAELLGRRGQLPRIVLLDCRTDGPNVPGATRIRLPGVLFRRLQNGTLPLTSICSLLADTSATAVVIPEEGGAEAGIAQALIAALNKNNMQTRLYTDAVDSLLTCLPSSPAEGGVEEMDGADQTADAAVTSLNLNKLRIERESVGGVRAGSDKRQAFPVQILPHLYLGNYETASNRDTLDKFGIHHIVNVTSNLPNAHEPDDRFHYLRISVDDNCAHNLSQHFPEAIAFIDAAGQRGDACLVHCLAGISRSVTVCLAYLMSTNRCPLEDAYDMVLGRNALIAPNFHFMGQLVEWERHLSLDTPVSSAPPRSPTCAAAVASRELPPASHLTPPPTSHKHPSFH